MAARRKYNEQDVAKALIKANGLITHAARLLKCTPKTVSSYIEQFPAVKEAYEEARETLLDDTENALYRQIQDGNITAIIFALKTIGKHRGYVERHDIGLQLSPEATALAKQLGIDKADIVREFEALIRAEAERVNST